MNAKLFGAFIGSILSIPLNGLIWGAVFYFFWNNFLCVALNVFNPIPFSAAFCAGLMMYYIKTLFNKPTDKG